MSNRNVRTYQARSEIGQAEGKIEIIVPLNYLNGSLKLSIDYTINSKPGYSNYGIECVKLSTHYDQYLAATPERVDPIQMVINNEIIENLTLALQYFQFVKKFLSENKRPPPSYAEFLTEQKNRAA